MSYKTKHIDGVRIAEGNTKLGEVPNVSLLPESTCPTDAPCKKDCYARKAMSSRFKGVKHAWGENTFLATWARETYFCAVDTYLTKYKPEYFRWHVAGDILDQEYFQYMRLIAVMHPNTSFLVFTKRHELSFGTMIGNLQVILSMWPRWGNTTKCMRRAWMQDGTETRIPKDAIPCEGHCDTCLACFKPDHRDVVFAKH